MNGIRNRFDFVGEKDRIPHLFEVKNGPTARMTPNQKINISIRPIHTKRQVNLPGSITQQDIVLVRRGMRTHLYVHQILTQTVRSQELKTYL